jgi:hypothetical protein
MTATTTKDRPATVGDLLQPKPASIDIDAHEADKKRRQAEHDANREELLKCLNPAYAAMKEAQKPQYKWTVSASWNGPHDGEMSHINASETVIAQDEADAWAMFCDKIGCWPSRRDAKPVIKRGARVSVEAVAAMVTAGVEDDAELPTVTLGAKPKSRKKS